MKYAIFTENEFDLKNVEIMDTGLYPNSTFYADKNQCKHPVNNIYAMPVLEPVIHLFDNVNLVVDLSEDWKYYLPKDFVDSNGIDLGKLDNIEIK